MLVLLSRGQYVCAAQREEGYVCALQSGGGATASRNSGVHSGEAVNMCVYDYMMMLFVKDLLLLAGP